MISKLIYIRLWSAFLVIHICSSLHIEGEIKTKETWAFVARFCFLPQKGQLAYVIEYDKLYAIQNLLLYYDTPDQWPSAYRPGLTCEQKEALLNNTNFIKLFYPYHNCSISTSIVTRREIVTCYYSTHFTTARQRWWYFAISHCNSTKGLNLRYKFQMTNGEPGDFWHEHFSADELYILPILMSFFVAYVILIVAVGFCTVELKARKMYHATYKIFVTSVILQEAGITIQMIGYIKYALCGKGLTRVRTFAFYCVLCCSAFNDLAGRLLEAASETVFLLLLLLLAKGYTVTRGRLRLASSLKLTVFLCLYSVSYLVIFIYERLFFDPGKVLYLYESPPGYGLIVLRVIAWWLFVYSIVFTLKHYPEKAVFYYPFNMLGTLWFVAGPAFILATNSFIDKWVRESVVCGALHFIALCGHLQFLFLTLPTTANKVFPYHVRTTQVAAMAVAEMDCTLPFSHHAYAPSLGPGAAFASAPPMPELPSPSPRARHPHGAAPAGPGPPLLDVPAPPHRVDWAAPATPVELFSVSRTVDSRTETIIPLKPYVSEEVSYFHHATNSVASGEGDIIPGKQHLPSQPDQNHWEE